MMIVAGLRRSRRMTQRLINRVVSPQAATTTLEEAIKPALDKLASDVDDALNKRFRKLTHVSV